MNKRPPRWQIGDVIYGYPSGVRMKLLSREHGSFLAISEDGKINVPLAGKRDSVAFWKDPNQTWRGPSNAR